MGRGMEVFMGVVTLSSEILCLRFCGIRCIDVVFKFNFTFHIFLRNYVSKLNKPRELFYDILVKYIQTGIYKYWSRPNSNKG